MDGAAFLIINGITGAIASAIAASKGRSAIGWFFGGFFLGLIGIIIVAVLPNLKEQERLRAHAASERRRLREQLKQEKMKTEAFRRHATGRLDTHDSALGLDTRQQVGLAAGGPGSAVPVPPPLPSPTPKAGETSWFYEAEGETRGPVPRSTLAWMLESGAIDGTTLVWTEGRAEWAALSSIPELGSASGGAG